MFPKQQPAFIYRKTASTERSFLTAPDSRRAQPLCFNTAQQIIIFILAEPENDLDVYNSRKKMVRWLMTLKTTINGKEERIPSSFNAHIFFSKSKNS